MKEQLTRAALESLSKDELISIILMQQEQIEAQQEQIQILNARLCELEKLLVQPKKNSKNSSLRPSSDMKSNKVGSDKSGKKRKGHGKGGRRLHPSPDKTIRSRLKKCPGCDEALKDDGHKLHNIYDHIELPKIQPVVTRIEQYKSFCKRCNKSYTAPSPQGYESGSPFGRSIETTACYLRYCHAIGYERLSKLFSDLFSLDVSEGSFANMFSRLQDKLDPRVEEILSRIRSSRLVCSDETGARVNAKNQWEWVFQNSEVCLHIIRDSRGKQVADEVLDGHRPTYWVSDLYSSQRNHAEKWQICLAHQLRDCEYVIEAGDKKFGECLQRIFWRATAIAKRRRRLADSTLKTYRYDLDRRLDRCISIAPKTEAGRKLKRRMLRERGNLFTFFDDREIEPTNNSSERALRPSAIFRKVTNCFRSEWGRDFYAAIRSVINTGQRQGMTAFESIEKALGADTSFIPKKASSDPS